MVEFMLPFLLQGDIYRYCYMPYPKFFGHRSINQLQVSIPDFQRPGHGNKLFYNSGYK
jgi:hypothetical protein